MIITRKASVDYRDVQRVIANPVLKKRIESGQSFLPVLVLRKEGNKIYRWYYSSTSFPTESWATIDDISNAEITTMAKSVG